MYSRKHYETIFKNRLYKNIDKDDRLSFISAAKRCECGDVCVDRALMDEHLTTAKLRLEKKGINFSAMKLRKKNTDCCTTLPF